MNSGSFQCICDERGVRALRSPRDPFGAVVTDSETPLGLILRYRVAGSAWRDLGTTDPRMTSVADSDGVTYTLACPDGALRVSQTFAPAGQGLDWTIELTSTGREPVEIGDLGVCIPVNGIDHEADARATLERRFLGHRLVCGAGSFGSYIRAGGAPPFLMLMALPGTHIEYFDRPAGESKADLFYIHSGRAGGEETRGDWRLPHTVLALGQGERVEYGFRFAFADSYDAMRDLLYEAGLFDIRAAPGMVIPEDLSARLSLRTKAEIHALEAEYPEATSITYLGEPKPDHHVYEIAFRKLGENRLTVRHDGGRSMHLEYFVTEPLETLIKKRAGFLVERQQVRDADKWWDGVYGTPHWHANRDPEERKRHASLDPTREHVWRSYDYPHMFMLY